MVYEIEESREILLQRCIYSFYYTCLCVTCIGESVVEELFILMVLVI